MASRLIALANAVVERINGTTFDGIGLVVSSRVFAAQITEQLAADGLIVRVAPIGKEAEKVAKATWNHDLRIGIGVCRRISSVPATADTEMQGMMQFMQDIEALLCDSPLTPTGFIATAIETATEPIFSQEAFLRGEFIAVLSVTFKAT